MDWQPDGAPAPGGSPRADDLNFAAVPAEPERLPALRHALARWAARAGLSAERVEALALAAYEALANAAAHAYSDGGALDLHATYRPEPGEVEVTVRDHGRWRPPPTERGGLGGRGLVLIRSLADHVDIATDASGTTVRMRWSLEVARR
jgi:serine/threonine-protein kinase RsbW